MAGFTLVELLMVAMLFVIVGGGLTVTFLTGRTSYVSADAYIQVQYEARRALDSMLRELRQAGNVTVTDNPGTMPTAKQLNFQIAREYNEQACGGICWGNEVATGQFVHYALIGAAGNQRQLVRCADANAGGAITVLGAGCRVLANGIRHPNDNAVDIFAYDAANMLVTVTIQTSYQSPALPGGDQRSGVLTSRVRLRNS